MSSLVHPSKLIANKSESNAYKDSANIVKSDDNDDFTEEGSQFHTWEVGEDSTLLQNSQVEEVVTVGTLQKSRSTYIHSDSEDEDETEDIDDVDPSVPGSSRPESGSKKKEEETLENPMSPTRVPSKVLELRPLVSEEVIAEKEASIRNLFFKCKDILMAATVFHMTNKYEEKVVNGDDMLEEQPVEGINDEECLRENPSKIGTRRSTPKIDAPNENHGRNKTNTELLLEKYNEEKGIGSSSNSSSKQEEKEVYSLREDVQLKASAKEEEPVRITIPKAGSGNDLTSAAAVRAKAEYKPLVHSAMRGASPVPKSVTTTTSTVINTTTIDTSDIPQPPVSVSASMAMPVRAASPSSNNGTGISVRASSPAGNVGIESEPSPSAASASTSSKVKSSAVRKTKQTSSTASITGGIAAQFSADIAKMAAPLGSGLTRHGTKIKTSSSAKLRGEVSASSNTATFVVGDNVQNLLNGERSMMSQSSSGALLQTNPNSIKPRNDLMDETIANVRITKKEHKQAFVVPSLSEAIESVSTSPAPAEPKYSGKSPGKGDSKDSKENSPPRSNYGESKAELSPTTRDTVPSSSSAAAAAPSNKGFGRFKNSSVVLDTRGNGDVRSSGEYHHGIQPYTPTMAAGAAASGVQSVFQRSFSEPTNMLAEAPSPGAISGSSTPRSPAARNPGVGSSIRIAQQMPIAKAIAAGAAPGATYRGFKIPQQARQAINPTASASGADGKKLHSDLSSLEQEIRKLSVVPTDGSQPPSARSPRPQPSHSTGALLSNRFNRYDDDDSDGEGR